MAPHHPANRLPQSAVGKQLRQETWDKHVAAEAVLSDRNLLFTGPTVSAAVLVKHALL